MKIFLFFLSSRGRLGRLAFTCLYVCTIVVLTLINNLFSFDEYIGYFKTGVANIIAVAVKEVVFDITNILSVIIFIFLVIKRLHDFNRSGFVLLYFSIIIFAGALFICYTAGGDIFSCVFNITIPVFLISNLFLCIWPGNNNDNKYGRKPASLFDLGLY